MKTHFTPLKFPDPVRMLPSTFLPMARVDGRRCETCLLLSVKGTRWSTEGHKLDFCVILLMVFHQSPDALNQ